MKSLNSFSWICDRLAFLTKEAREKLIHARPRTIAAARQLEGVTPAALLELFTLIKKANKRRKLQDESSDDDDDDDDEH
jgi:tRNA U34 5-carboxymethylaminomethyl modifying enzyme MnmG/GidA